jgi:hypothetical protein
VRDEDLADTFGGNHRLRASHCDDRAQCIAIVGFVGDDATGRKASEKVGRGRNVVGFAARENEA